MVENKEKPKLIVDKAVRDKVFDHAVTLFSGFIATHLASPDGQLNVDIGKNFPTFYKIALELNMIRLKVERDVLEQIKDKEEKP